MKKKIIVISSVVLLLVASILTGCYFYFRDPNKLTAREKRYLADNLTTVQNISVLNNVPIFGDTGEGLFYDFLNDFSSHYNFSLNTVAYNLGEASDGISFGAGNTLTENEVSFYKDHYILVSKDYEFISDKKQLNDKKIGILSENLSYVTSYLQDINSSIFASYENQDQLLEAFKNQEEIQYMIVPMHLYLPDILENSYAISYHFSDIYYYYKYSWHKNNTLSSIMNKYFNDWITDKFTEYYNDHLFQLFTDSLNITSADIEEMRGVTYQYGLVDYYPYELLMSGNYGGILAQYLKEFMEFSDVEIEFNKYKNLNQLSRAINRNKIDIYFAYHNLNTSFKSISSGIEMDYQVIANKEDNLVVESLKSLDGQKVYVEADTDLYTYLKNNTKMDLRTYKDDKDLKKIVKKGELLIIDSNIYFTNQQNLLSLYRPRYHFTLNKDYAFRLNTNNTFTTLFSTFMQYKDAKSTLYEGLYNYDKTIKSGTIVGTIARYFMYILIAFVLIFLYIYKVTKKIKISKKIKKEDKLKYIDQLTSLKNRNYLSENLDSWSKNTVYPQTIIVVDLNNLQNINDTMGYEQGDMQIKAAANVLVKTQLDNSEIIRTDGNEFVIYLVGYQTKQITSYIHKLTKEFKKLPYEYGAAIGYSMILDDMKSVEDAMNEAVEDVKRQKVNKKEEAHES